MPIPPQPLYPPQPPQPPKPPQPPYILLLMLRIISRRFCLPTRQTMQYDIAIVGGGVAGLSTAIRLKQLQQKFGRALTICLFEKGNAIGNHILSGNCFEPGPFTELFPDWRTMEGGPPIQTSVVKDEFQVLFDDRHVSIPQFLLPLHNRGNYLVSLSRVSSWMGTQAQNLGVDVFPGTAVDELLIDQKGQVVGVATKDTGISKKNQFKPTYARGIEIRAKQVVLAQGCRGSLSEQAIDRFKLREKCDPQIYGIGLKEVWQVPDETFKKGTVFHSVGWPLPHDVYGGSFIYHMDKNQVHIGMVVGLDYSDPLLNPYNQFQRLKTHPSIIKHLNGGRCISYGARALNQGGYYSIPKLVFPGGMLVGCSAGFLNVAKIKGAHNAIKSGILAAQSLYKHVVDGKSGECQEYQNTVKTSSIYRQLWQSRNFKGGFKNIFTGLAHGAVVTMLTKGYEPWQLRNRLTDSKKYRVPGPEDKQKQFPSGPFVRKLLDNLALSGTNHEHDQPSHLVVKTGCESEPEKSLAKLQGPEQRFCPAKVYQFVEGKLVINAQNCLHCKTCSIKMPEEYVEWRVPEGKGGPRYSCM